MNAWHTLCATETLRRLGTTVDCGLEDAEATRRLSECGPNTLTERGARAPWRIAWEQITSTMVMILIVAAILSAFLGDYRDTVVILLIVVLNAALGFAQEYRAERAMAALKRLAAPLVAVRRSGRVREIPAAELVPGDILLLHSGNVVSADARLLTGADLRTQEAALTGEAEPVHKDPAMCDREDIPLGDRRNCLYRGTQVVHGHAEAVVTDTGMATEIGRIAAMIQTVQRAPTPLQLRLDRLGRDLAIVALVIVLLIFSLGVARGEEPALMFLTAVSTAVAAVPEGLPAVVTIVLALGAQQMLRRRALIRKLPAVETLGAVTVICTDKTGTLTENRMTVVALNAVGHAIDLRDRLPASSSAISDPTLLLRGKPTLPLLLLGAALCNDASVTSNEAATGQASGTPTMGDPTEVAGAVAAAALGYDRRELEQAFPRVGEIPFDPTRKRMTTLHRLPAPSSEWHAAICGLTAVGGGSRPIAIAFTKGAFDHLLEVCTRVRTEHGVVPLGSQWRDRLIASHDRMAGGGARVLGVAMRVLSDMPLDAQKASVERDLVFVGLIGMRDRPREEAVGAVATCRAAGIRTVMITGDHPLTAGCVAEEMGIDGADRILVGADLGRLSASELDAIVDDVSVYARVTPEHKLRIVQALQSRRAVVAMTGDGVNDAPALKRADIGVAMGRGGTDVAKESADLVILDDNFATIVTAVREGRVIYDNIRKFVRYLMTSNSAEIWVMLLAPLLGMPLPLLPLQILWINLVTDGPPALALGFETAESDIMARPPRRANSGIVERAMAWSILRDGLLMGLLALVLGFGYWRNGHAEWQTMLFTVLTLSQMANVLAVRSSRDSLFRIGLWSNPALMAAVVLTFVLQMAVVYIPVLQPVFRTQSLPPADLLFALLVSSVVFWSVEAEKWLIRRRARVGAA